MPREIDVRFLELGVRPGQVGGPLAGTGNQRRNVARPFRPALRIPAETLHIPFILRQLDHRIGIVLGVVEIIDLVQVSIVEQRVQHLGFHLVHGGERIVLREEEQGCRPAQGVETLQGARAVEISHHLGAPDLVVTQGILLRRDEGVGHQPGAFGPLVPDDDIGAVGGVLPVAVAEYERILVQPYKGIQVIVGQGVA